MFAVRSLICVRCAMATIVWGGRTRRMIDRTVFVIINAITACRYYIRGLFNVRQGIGAAWIIWEVCLPIVIIVQAIITLRHIDFAGVICGVTAWVE